MNNVTTYFNDNNQGYGNSISGSIDHLSHHKQNFTYQLNYTDNNLQAYQYTTRHKTIYSKRSMLIFQITKIIKGIVCFFSKIITR